MMARPASENGQAATSHVLRLLAGVSRRCRLLSGAAGWGKLAGPVSFGTAGAPRRCGDDFKN
jgi:hypothetical protein